MHTPEVRRAPRLIMALLFALTVNTAYAAPPQQVMMHILDYVGVDYPGTVNNGRVVNAAEYAEQKEFVQHVVELAGELPDSPARADIIKACRELQTAVEQHAAGAQVIDLTRRMRAQLVESYNIATSPRNVPDLSTGATLFQSTCARCHGANGFGDGPQGAKLDPPPINFHDPERQRQRSIYGLYNTITMGVGGTAMRGFTEFTEQQRWALAFYVSNFLFEDSDRAAGERLWQQNKAPAGPRTLNDLSVMTPNQAAEQGGDAGVDVLHA